MRIALTALLAFLLGLGTMAVWQAWHFRPAPAPHHVAVDRSVSKSPAPALTVPATAETTSATQEDSSGTLSDRGWPHDAPTPEQVIYSQSDLLDKAIAQLHPRTPGKVNLYAIAFAGDGSENVFRNEAEYLQRLFAARFDAAGHVLVLENNPSTLATRPLADWSNLESALDAMAEKMDPKQDILLLYLTTHGSEDHTLLVDMDPLPLDQIGASDLPGILAEHPFRYRVVVVNACYSGGFIPPLRGNGTMVITAARSDRSSFGCGEQSQLTWFGHAFLVDALNRTANFRDAFGLARQQVAAWEKRDDYQPSDPQISAGEGIAAQLGKWRGGFAPGAAIPFAPASSTARPE
ncbi:MAG: peptidase C13 [Proteobacteria bacterium]|nr:peptidase C13 [Pseudomonadota bacterium]